jgi:uracil-DNA glycosylase
MNIIDKVNIGWLPFFDEHKEQLDKILNEINFNDNIFPEKKNIFKALFYFPPEDIKLFIMGQDPYIGYEIINEIKIPQACGLSFSVPKSHKKIPPSLQNIFKEIKNCYPDYIIPKNGSLKRWVKKEKILLLNSALTVIEGKSNSHAKLWTDFTNKLIKFISDKNNKTIFLLMGNFAINKKNLIDENKHKIFTTVHPSPLSASRGFFGCNIFKNINDYLIENNKEPINW